MRVLAPALILWFALAAPAGRADDAIPAKTLAELKAATVFIKVETARAAASGSGFVIRVDDDTALIVTNEHVVVPPRALGAVGRIEVVFNSGRPKDERVVVAELLAADASRDLAVLRVKGVKGLAGAIDLSKKAAVTETSTVFALGFPFGTALSTGKGNPAVTIGKGTVSSLREDDAGEVSVVQIDGDINPGNSGGPVVDAQGRLVGVAVAKVTGTRIGLAIPPAELTRMLDGRIGGVTTRVSKAEAGAVEVDVTFRFIDPLGKVSKAGVRIARKTPGEADPTGKARDRKPLPKADEFPLTVDAAGQKATATIPLKSDDRGFAEYWVQPVYTNGAKAGVLVSPVTLRVDFSGRAAIVPPKVTPGSGTPTPIPAGSVPEPKLTGKLTTAAADAGDLKATKIMTGAPDERPGGYYPPACMTWTPDAKAFYHLDAAGTVRRITYPELKEDAALATGRKCGWMSLSKVGPVVTVTDAQEAWVLDPATLKVTARIPIAKAKAVAATPTSEFGFAAEADFRQSTLTVLDLKAGKLLKQLTTADLGGRGLVGLEYPTFSPDGKYLFTSGGLEQVYRFKVDGQALRLQEAGPRIIQGAYLGLSVGADYVAAPSGGGNYGIGADRPGYGTFVFAHGDLKKPVLSLKSGAYPQAVGFDPAAGLFYAHNSSSQLIVFNKEGIKLKEYAIGQERLTRVGQFLVHPTGGKVLIVINGDVYAVEVPKF